MGAYEIEFTRSGPNDKKTAHKKLKETENSWTAKQEPKKLKPTPPDPLSD
jgi:hypothetical protein